MGNAFCSIYNLTFFILCFKARISAFLDPLGNFRESPIPGLLFPAIAVRCSVEHFRYPILVVYQLVKSSTLGTQSSLIDGMVRITFGIDNLGIFALCAVASL